MMKLFINDQQIETDQNSNVSISLSVASISALNTRKTGYSKSISIPMTARNMEIMGDVEQINASSLFNSKEHKTRIEKDGSIILEGTAQLIKSCRDDSLGGYYLINIIGTGKDWLKVALKTQLSELGIIFSATLTGQTIASSWTWNKPVKFLPVKRVGSELVNVNSNISLPIKVLTYENYHPFIKVKDIVDKIFEKSGYTIESDFFNSCLFDSLYISGNYATKNVSNAEKGMDFNAGRIQDATAVADSYGRVYTNVYRLANTIGNIVDSSDPAQIPHSSKDIFDLNGCLQKNDERISFNAYTYSNVGFEFSIFYTTDFRIKSSTELTGFDTIYLGDGIERRFSLANRNVDRKNELKPNTLYKVCAFNATTTASFEVRYSRTVVTNGVQSTTVCSHSGTGRFFAFTTMSGTLSNAKLYIKNGSSLTEYVLDWAVYDGYVKETGEIDVEVKVRSVPRWIAPSQPKYFNDIWFGGAQAGMKFTINKKTTLKPVLSQYAYEGSIVNFKQVCSHNITGAEIIDALRHMFNLSFYTDTISKTVYIEPNHRFFRTEKIVDWSQKLDRNKPLTITEPGADMAAKITVGYRSGDRAVAAYNVENEENFGTWSAEILNTQSEIKETSYINPLFTPTINEMNNFPDAAYASVMCVGKDSISEQEDLNFIPKIVSYVGMVDLPDGQRWGWPSYATQYPLAAFLFLGTRSGGTVPEDSYAGMIKNGFSLCFEDTFDVKGLHRMYDRNIDLYNNSKRLEAYIMLFPEDIEQLVYPNRLGEDFRALYKLEIDGEYALFRLEEVVDYNPLSSGSTKCVFIKETSF